MAELLKEDLLQTAVDQAAEVIADETAGGMADKTRSKFSQSKEAAAKDGQEGQEGTEAATISQESPEQDKEEDQQEAELALEMEGYEADLQEMLADLEVPQEVLDDLGISVEGVTLSLHKVQEYKDRAQAYKLIKLSLLGMLMNHKKLFSNTKIQEKNFPPSGTPDDESGHCQCVPTGGEGKRICPDVGRTPGGSAGYGQTGHQSDSTGHPPH